MRVQQLTMSDGLARSFECINKGGELGNLDVYNVTLPLYTSLPDVGITHVRYSCSPAFATLSEVN